MIPRKSCMIPDKTTASKNNSKEPSEVMDESTMAARPAAGPDTLT